MSDQNGFEIQILGRTLEHLGVQMYKKRNTAIAELVANCWDAGATEVRITIPQPSNYDQEKSMITIFDNGNGMSEEDIRNGYLVIGRNRRKEDDGISNGRRVMGRKGIGKLAGFGMAKNMVVKTWQEKSQGIQLELSVDILKSDDNKPKSIPIPSEGFKSDSMISESGTIIELSVLKHQTPINIEDLHESLGRRFSRSTKNEMKIYINDNPLKDIDIELDFSFPKNDSYEEVKLSDGNSIKFNYSFAKKPIPSKELRGFVVYANGKIAQAPDFFFNMEGKVTGQHGNKYIFGEIIADYLDKGTDDESDNISTDRQEVDWEAENIAPLKDWGEKKMKSIFLEWLEFRGDSFVEDILKKPEFIDRIKRLDPTSQQQVDKILNIIGKAGTDETKSTELASTLIRAYEYRHFHDVINEIENAAETEPIKLQELLQKLSDWKILESRSIYEIINGRLSIIEKFHSMIVNDSPETASKLSKDNMHDLIAGYPWLIKPEWQVLSEEKKITNELKNWNVKDDKKNKERYDFIALTGDKTLVIIEIKRSGHAVELEELQRAERYQERLRKAHPETFLLFISGGTYNVSPSVLDQWKSSKDKELSEWNVFYQSTKQFYSHYKDVLEGNIEGKDFKEKEREVLQTKKVLNIGTVHRDKNERSKGIGPQDSFHDDDKK